MNYLPDSGAAAFSSITRFGQQALASHEAKKATSPATSDGPIPQVDRFWNAYQDDPEKFPKESVLVHCLSNIFAGSDTTGISLTAIAHNLCCNPASVRKLRKEVEECASNRGLLDPITFKETQRMPYLNALIKGIDLSQSPTHPTAWLTNMPQRVFVSILQQVCHFFVKSLREVLQFLGISFPRV